MYWSICIYVDHLEQRLAPLQQAELLRNGVEAENVSLNVCALALGGRVRTVHIDRAPGDAPVAEGAVVQRAVLGFSFVASLGKLFCRMS